MVLFALATSTTMAEDFGAYFDEISNEREIHTLTFEDDVGIEEIAYRVPIEKEKCHAAFYLMNTYYDDETRECVILTSYRENLDVKENK